MPNLADHEFLKSVREVEREPQITAALEAIPGFALLVDPQGRILRVNSRFKESFGTLVPGARPGEAAACPHAVESGCGSSPQCPHCVIFQAVRSAISEEPQWLEGDWTTALGTRVVEVLSTPFEIVGKKFAMVSVRDVTQRRELEALRDALRDRLFQSAKLTSLATLAAGMAHEINNPLAIVVGNASLLLRLAAVADDATARHRIDSIINAAERIGNIVKNIQSFAEKEQSAPVTFDLSALVLSTLGYFRSQLQAENIEVLCDKVETGLMAEACMGSFQQALVHVLNNARDAILASDNPTRLLTVSATVQGESIEITIGDTGIGMSPWQVERACDPFFTTKDPGKGTGIGLTIVHRTLESMGGRVKIESELGAGTTVRLTLPRAS